MTDDPPGASRRRFLGSAGAACVAVTAGCLGAAFESEPEEIEPVEPSDPPEGTPGEFYYVLEDQDQFDIEVGDLYWADSALEGEDRDLILEYYSDAEPVDPDEDNESTTNELEEDDELEDQFVDPAIRAESEEEMGLIMQVYNEILVEHGNTDTGMLVAEIQNPFDGQAHGWGVKTEWLEQYNAGEMDDFSLWMNVANSRVYEDDIEAAELDDDDVSEEEFEDGVFEDDLEGNETDGSDD